MRILVAAALALIVAGTGCVYVPRRSSNRAAVSAKDCPPGHRWSDGTCHATGKGHDPAKHAR